ISPPRNSSSISATRAPRSSAPWGAAPAASLPRRRSCAGRSCSARRRWTPEFGSPLNPTDLRALVAYSPVTSARMETSYPPALITVGERDDYLTPANSYKLAATLQWAQSGSGAELLRVDPDMGHGPGTPRSRQLSLDADRLRFLAGVLHGLR